MSSESAPVTGIKAQPALSWNLTDQLETLKEKWPLMYECIDQERLTESATSLISSLAERAFDFDSIKRGGRGESYRRAQDNPLIRAEGIRQLLELTSRECHLKNLTPLHTILDVLGGDGVLARATPHFFPTDGAPNILTSDLSEGMVRAAQSYGLFAMQQAAQKLLLKDASVDGVILAYGTHHIPVNERSAACSEAFRVLKPGGQIVFHDFEEDSPMTDWFSKVVDKYSMTGHRCPHFTRREIRDLLAEAGFANVSVKHMYDPFRLVADTREEAQQFLSDYLLDMYGLCKLVEQEGREEAVRIAYALAKRHFKYDYAQYGLKADFGVAEVSCVEKNRKWEVEMPRVALVGRATRP